MHVPEIILIGPVTPMPSVPEYVRGLTNLRGHVIPIIDLAKRFGRESSPDTAASRIVVLNVSDKTRGVVVAAGDDVVRGAGGADLFVVGVVQGACSKARLFQAGAAIVYRNFEDFADSAASGATDMIEAGLLPASLG